MKGVEFNKPDQTPRPETAPGPFMEMLDEYVAACAELAAMAEDDKEYVSQVAYVKDCRGEMSKHIEALFLRLAT